MDRVDEYKWYERAVFYHIYPLGMCGAEPVNDGKMEPSDRMRELAGFILHMEKLSVSGLYIGPLFESAGHGYETADYYMVDRRLGSNADFKAFVSKCHAAGIRVVVDGVFHHTGRGFFAFRDILEKREASRYTGWYCNLHFGGENAFHDGFSYEAWHGYEILPKLNLKNAEVAAYLLEAVRFWISEFDIDGIRLDTADVLDFAFMERLRRESEGLKADFWLMGEVIHGEYSRWVHARMLHAVTNYPLHKALYSGHNDYNYFEIAHTVNRLFDSRTGIVKNAGLLYSFAENQDVDRLASKLKEKRHLRLVYLLLFTLPGIPSIYYGGEFGLEGRHIGGSDAGLRPVFHVSEYDTEDALYRSIRWMAEARRTYKPLAGGAYQELALTNRQYAFARLLPSEGVLVFLNSGDMPVQMQAAAPFGGRARDVETGEAVEAEGGILRVALEGFGGRMFYIQRDP